MTSAIGVAILVVVGIWLFGGLLARWAGALLLVAGSAGLASTGDADGFLLITLGAALWRNAFCSGSVLRMSQARGNNRPDASRRFSSRSGVSLDQLLKGADRIRKSRSLPGGSPGAAKLIREDRNR